VRGVLREVGLFIPKGADRVVAEVFRLVEDEESEIPDACRPFLFEACSEIQPLETRMANVEHQLKALAHQLPEVQRLLTIPGIGLLTATAIVGFIGDLRRFRSGRRFSSYLGLVSKEKSSGEIRRLGRITKQGDTYIRVLLTLGARGVLWSAKSNKNPDRIRAWALKIEQSRGHNKAVVALANKLARIAWAVSVHQREFHSVPLAA
jgi:transposase